MSDQPTPPRRLRPLLEGFDRVVTTTSSSSTSGYGAYLGFYELCSEAFPDISDQRSRRWCAGIDVVALRPDDELKRLAMRAVELGVADASPECTREARQS